MLPMSMNDLMNLNEYDEYDEKNEVTNPLA